MPTCKVGFNEDGTVDTVSVLDNQGRNILFVEDLGTGVWDFHVGSEDGQELHLYLGDKGVVVDEPRHWWHDSRVLGPKAS